MMGVLFTCCPSSCCITVFCISFLMNMLLTLLEGLVESFLCFLFHSFWEDGDMTLLTCVKFAFS